MRKFILLAYNGEPFHGWQRQPNASSVQQTLEEALGIALRRPINVVGAGRTDTGVHARKMYAHFDTEDFPEDTDRLIRSLNRLVGPDIAIYDIFDVSPDAHARFDAQWRTYKYFITFCKSPFYGHTSWHSPTRLDMAKMNEAASMLLKVADFTSFAKLHSDSKTNFCKVSEAAFKKWEPGSGITGLVFTITSDRFLRNMVRAVVGTLVDVGRGKLELESFREIIEKKNRGEAGTSMPPQALFLWDIGYPDSLLRASEVLI